MKVNRYVEFVTTDGKRKLTNRMSQTAYIIKMMLLNLIVFGLGVALGVVYVK